MDHFSRIEVRPYVAEKKNLGRIMQHGDHGNKTSKLSVHLVQQVRHALLNENNTQAYGFCGNDSYTDTLGPDNCNIKQCNFATCTAEGPSNAILATGRPTYTVVAPRFPSQLWRARSSIAATRALNHIKRVGCPPSASLFFTLNFAI